MAVKQSRQMQERNLFWTIGRYLKDRPLWTILGEAGASQLLAPLTTLHRMEIPLPDRLCTSLDQTINMSQRLETWAQLVSHTITTDHSHSLGLEASLGTWESMESVTVLRSMAIHQILKYRPWWESSKLIAKLCLRSVLAGQPCLALF